MPLSVLAAGFLLALAGHSEAPEQALTGTLRGKLLDYDAGRPVHLNLHRGDGGYLRAVQPQADGQFAAEGLRFGDYFVITDPNPKRPVQWISANVTLTAEKPAAELPPLNCYAAKPVSPHDGLSVRRPELTRDRPVVFRWAPHPETAEYEVTLQALEGGKAWQSGRIRKANWKFYGGRTFRRTRLRKAYAWSLHIYPAHRRWQGHSRQQTFYQGGHGRPDLSAGEFVTLAAPRWYWKYARSYHMVRVLDLAYLFQEDLTGRRPFGGQRAGVLFDTGIEFSHSGNPVHIGANYWRHDRPPWFTIFHEMGHDFQTGSSPGLTAALCHQSSGVSFYHDFVEALATLGAFYVSARVQEQPAAELDPSTIESVRRDVAETEERCRLSWRQHLEQNTPFEELNPDGTDGMLLELCDEFGWGMFRTFFRLFNSGDEALELCRRADTHPKRMALVFAALSAAASRDLRERFAKWKIPLSFSDYELYLAEWQRIAKRLA